MIKKDNRLIKKYTLSCTGRQLCLTSEICMVTCACLLACYSDNKTLLWSEDWKLNWKLKWKFHGFHREVYFVEFAIVWIPDANSAVCSLQRVECYEISGVP